WRDRRYRPARRDHREPATSLHKEADNGGACARSGAPPPQARHLERRGSEFDAPGRLRPAAATLPRGGAGACGSGFLHLSEETSRTCEIYWVRDRLPTPTGRYWPK